MTGQDGAYLAKRLQQKGISVTGTCRDPTTSDLWRLRELDVLDAATLYRCDLANFGQIETVLKSTKPDWVFNFAGVTSLGEAAENPELTYRVNGVAVEHMLDVFFAQNPEGRFFQASSAQLLLSDDSDDPGVLAYSDGKRSADQSVLSARRAGHFAVSGMLFNHESPLRTERFVSRKIAAGLVQWRDRGGPALRLGALDQVRDWSFAGDIVSGAFLSLAHCEPDDYQFASGAAHKVRDWVDVGCEALGIELVWSGTGLDEIATCRSTGKAVVEIDPMFYRPEESERLVGDPSKAANVLRWRPEYDFEGLVSLMIKAELKRSA